MLKRYFTFGVIVACVVKAYCGEMDCDVILTKQNFQIPCVVTNITESYLQYKDCPTTRDTFFSMPVVNIRKVYMYNGIVIDYSNGTPVNIPEIVKREVVHEPIQSTKSSSPEADPENNVQDKYQKMQVTKSF